MTFARIILGLGFALSPLSAHALFGPVQDCMIRNGFEEQASNIHKVTRIGSESRKPIPKNLYGKFAATGAIDCGDGPISAQLVGDNKTVTTAAHFFLDKACKPKPRIQCTFDMFAADGTFKRIPLKMDSLKLGRCPILDRNNDWAVLNLESAAKGVDAYGLPEKDELVKPGTEILQLSGLATNFSVNGQYPRAMETCRVEEVIPYDDHPVRHSCDSGQGTSGSGQYVLNDKKKLVMVAISVAESNKRPEGTNYISNTHYNISTPVAGDFLQAIRAANGK